MIEPDEERKDRIGEMSEKVGDIVLAQPAKKRVVNRSDKVKDRKKVKTPKETIKELVPVGDEKSVRRTIGATIITLCVIAAFALVVSAIVFTTTTVFGEFGLISGLVILLIGIGIPIGIVAFFVGTANKEEKEPHIEERLK